MSEFDGNAELIRRVAGGDDAALDELVRVNLGLVKSIVLRFRDRGVEFEDLMQLGTIGMIKAARSFDFKYNCAFSTYAVPLIIGEIRRFLRDDGAVKVSRTTKKTGVDIMRKRELFMRENGREPTVNELSERCGIEPAELTYALESVAAVHSLSEPVGEDNMTLENVIADKNNEIELTTDRIALAQAVGCLPELQRKIVTLRYIKCLSQQQTGELLGLTQVKISREEKKILERLRSLL